MQRITTTTNCNRPNTATNGKTGARRLRDYRPIVSPECATPGVAGKRLNKNWHRQPQAHTCAARSKTRLGNHDAKADHARAEAHAPKAALQRACREPWS